ncbi:MAG TPA: mechanosensitive ion channel protein MscS, partial [Arthrobacter bacterium]|nr:mechanosensitive ion channel protein MscS [Arthrobacter sp.]
MFSTMSITPPPLSSPPSGVSITGIVISLGVGIAIWLVATFVISRISRRVAAGSNFFKKPHFKWVAPALRALDHERRVQRAETIGSLLNSIVGVLVAVITTMYVLQNLDINI